MRVVTENASGVLKTRFDDTVSDRHVAFGTFIPRILDIDLKYENNLEMIIIEYLKLQFGFYLGPVLTTGAIASSTRRAVSPRGNGADTDETDTDDEILTLRFSDVDRREVRRISDFVAKAKTLPEIINTLSKFQRSPQYRAVEATLASQPLINGARVSPNKKLWEELDRLTWIFSKPVGVPDQTSDIGYLFLDRTRISPQGFAIGEHVYSLGLAPGEEVILEQKSSTKELVSLEEEIEREFEQMLEFENELTTTDDESFETQRTDTSTTTLSGDASAGVTVPVKGVPVNAEAGGSAGQTWSSASSQANKTSLQVAHRKTERAAAKIRSLHKTKFTVSTETMLESSSRRILRNPNATTPVSLHYFKVMRRVHMQQERFGVRLCWAPFIKSPGRAVRLRMREARERVFARALKDLTIPVPPKEPKPDLAPRWQAGDTYAVFVGPLGLDEEFVRAEVKIPKDVTWTGRTRIRMVDDIGKRASFSFYRYYEASGPNLDDYDTSDDEMSVSDLVVVTAGAGFPPIAEAKFQLLAEIIPGNPTYDEELAKYQEALQHHQEMVAEMGNEAKKAVSAEADAAELAVLRQTDIRSELMASVIAQYVAAADRDEAGDVEIWHRTFDFDNIGFMLYPGWWDGALPYPQFGASHFVNSSWARVFLPVRPGHEANALYLLAQPDAGDAIAVAKFNQFVTELEQGLVEEAKKYVDSNGMPKTVPIDPSWEVTVPTDGTHVEAVLGATTAADDLTAARSQVLLDQMAADLAGTEADNTLKGQVQTPVPAQIVIDGTS